MVNKSIDQPLEAKLFKTYSETGMGVRIIEHHIVPSDQSNLFSYRVEEYINGRTLSFLELRSTMVQRSIIDNLVRLNYNDKMIKAIQELKG